MIIISPRDELLISYTPTKPDFPTTISTSEAVACCVVDRRPINADGTTTTNVDANMLSYYISSGGVGASWHSCGEPTQLASSTVTTSTSSITPPSRSIFSLPSFAPATADSAASFVGEMMGWTKDDKVTARSVVTLRTATSLAYWPAFVRDRVFFIKVPTVKVDMLMAFGIRESVVAALELADEVLHCTSIVVCLDKSFAADQGLMETLLHQIGFALVAPSMLPLPVGCGASLASSSCLFLASVF